MEAGRRRGRFLALIAGAALVLGGGAAAWLVLRGDEPPATPRIGARAGATLAAGAIGAIALAEEVREPYHCARWRADDDGDADEDRDAGAAAEPEVLTAFGRNFAQRGPVLRIDGGDRELVVGVVADARGAEPRTLAQLATVRAAFERAGVELVLSLGGMGSERAELHAVLDALTRDAPWPVVAIPGGRESLPAHRAAVAAIADAGRGVIFDGSTARIVVMDGVAIGTVPGIAEAGQLPAGNDGCVHEVEELMQFADAFAALPAPRVLASYAPPRQGGEVGSDVAAGGVHIGEPMIARLTAKAAPTVIVHGLVDEAADDPQAGKLRRQATRPLVVGAGAVEGLPLWTDDGRAIGGSALVIEVAKNRLGWRRIALPVAVD